MTTINRMHHKILVFTDIHIKSEGEKIVGYDPLERFDTGLKHALKHHPDADHLILTGDLTHNGRPDQFARLKPLLADLPLPVTLMTGNHDRRDTLLEAFPDQLVTESGHLMRAIDLQGAAPFGPKDRLICLDTLDGPPWREHHHAGALCRARMEWLKEQLDTAGERRVSIFMHHPPFHTGFDGMDAIRMMDHDAFYDLVKQYPNVAHIFAGHIHRTISGTAHGIGFTIFKSPTHQMPMMLGETGYAHSVPEPGAYGIILLSDEGVIVHSEDFDEARRHAVQGYDD